MMRSDLLRLALAAGALLALPALQAQAPAGAPAGANGICKDGTYSTAASKDGACRGHKGVQTWYAASGASAPAPVPAGRSQAMPAPTPASSPAMPAPTPAASSPSVATSSRRSPSASLAGKTAAPGGGPGLVWVNTSSNVYHCNGDDVYGKTKAGAYMSEADAKAKGARAARGQACTGK